MNARGTADRALVPGKVNSNVDDIQFIDEIPRDGGDQITGTGLTEIQDSSSYPGSTLLNSSVGVGTTTVPLKEQSIISASSQHHRVPSSHYQPPPGGSLEEPSSRVEQDISKQPSSGVSSQLE